jgi:SAM-dependent methyltransferase
MRSELYEEMYRLEQTHWWFQGRARIVMNLLQRYLPGEGAARIADLGCGCGMMLSRFRTAGYDAEGMEAFDEAISFCAQRGINVSKGFLPDPLPLERGGFEAVTMLDVLEHLDDDINSAKAAAELLKPGGILLCTVPAYPWLWAKRDEHHQHKRRYTKSRFRSLFTIPTLKIETLTYYNTWLFPLAAAARLATRLRRADDAPTDLKVPAAPINKSLETIFASERATIGRIPQPFGLSLVAVARRV